MWKLSSLVLLFSLSAFGQIIRPNNLFMPLTAAGGGGTVTFDSQSSTSTPNSVASIAFPITNSASADRYLAVGVAISSTTILCTNVTYNAVALTKLGSVLSQNADGQITLWGLAAPASGSNNVIVTLNGSSAAGLEAGAIGFTQVSQATPTSNMATNAGSGTSVTLTVTSGTGNMVVDVVGAGSAVTGAIAGPTQRWIQNNNGNTKAGNAAGSTRAGSASVNMGYTITSDSWGIVGVSLNHD